jgi:thymidylate synthase
MRVYRGKDFATVYEHSLQELMANPEYETRPRDLLVKENINTVLILENPLACLYSNEFRSSQKKYISAELLWYFMGRNDVEFISEYAKFWKTIQNFDGTVNSSYGNLLFTEMNDHGFTQYGWAIGSLIKDKDSRQAVMHFNLPKHQYRSNKDFVCTMYGNFHIRNNKLHLTISMRSNDVIWGLPTDLAFFVLLQSQALSHLRKHYPDLEMGTYTHIDNSFHIYEHHFEAIEKMLTSELKPETIPAVGIDLITEEGDPTPELIKFFSDFKNPDPILLQDPLFAWINKHIQ